MQSKDKDKVTKIAEEATAIISQEILILTRSQEREIQDRILAACDKAITNVAMVQDEAYRIGYRKGQAAQPQRSEGQHGSDGMPPLRGPSGVKPRITIAGHDYMLVSEHYAALNAAASSEHEHEFESDGGGCVTCGQTVAQLLTASSEPQEWTPEWLDSMGIDGERTRELVCEWHKAALAASFNRGRLEGVFMSPNEDEANYVRKLEQELADERERRKPLVEALERIAHSKPHMSNISPVLEAKAALASAKEGK